MPLNDREILKEKIKNFLENRINNLNNKLNDDLKSIEYLKYNYYDNCMKQFEKCSNLNKNNNNTNSNENIIEKPKEIEKFKKITVIKKTHKQTNSLLQKSVKVFNQTYIKLNRNIHFNSFNLENPMNKTFDKLNKKNNNIDLFKTHFNSINNKKNYHQKIFQKSKTNISDDFSNKKLKINLIDKSCIKLPNKIKINNNIKCLYFLIEKNFINNKLKYNIIISLPTLYNIIYKKDLRFLLKNKPNEIENKIKLLEEKYKNILDYENIESNKFIPSKKCLNGLNYITKEEINNFIRIEKTGLPNEIKNIFLILIYLFNDDEIYEFKNDDNLIIDVHFKNILIKYNAKNIKKLFLKYIEIYPYLNISKNKFEKLNKIFNENKNILNNEEIAKINRPLSYISFILNEIYLYINKKNNDIYFYEIINKSNEIIKLKKNLEILKDKMK